MIPFTHRLLDWDEETYHSRIPLARTAFRQVREHPLTDEAFEAVRSIFLKYNVHEELALCVIHRHFELEPKEQLVHFNNVTAPWRIEDSPDYLQPNIRPKNWAFLGDGALFPYEFEFSNPDEEPTSTPALPFPATFSTELYQTLTEIGMQGRLGIVCLTPDDVDPTTRKMEFTAGRTSVVVPMTEAMEQMARVESSWFFPCFQGAFGPHGSPRTRLCWLECRSHDDD